MGCRNNFFEQPVRLETDILNEISIFCLSKYSLSNFKITINVDLLDLICFEPNYNYNYRDICKTKLILQSVTSCFKCDLYKYIDKLLYIYIVYWPLIE